MTINWQQWNDKVIEDYHGRIKYYRDLYEGEHADLFPRARNLIEKGEIIDNILQGKTESNIVRTPYIVANITKLIPEVPAMLVSRSIGDVNSSLDSSDEQNAAVSSESAEQIESPGNGAINDEVINFQREIIEQIQKNSNLRMEHWSNIVAHQVDGGLVGVPIQDELGLRIEFKQRDVYFPHDDGKGADLGFNLTVDEIDYLHVYRERVEEFGLSAEHFLYEVKHGNVTETVEEEEAKKILQIDELRTEYRGRFRLFIQYWANEKTFTNPLGVSVLKGQEGKQDEINWTLTRNSLVFERNGKPRLAISKEIFQALEEKSMERYGEPGIFDHRDLEITTIDEQGYSMEVIQIDISNLGDIQWVKDLMKMMFMETKTSEKAVDFYMDTESSAAQSGVAKFYDLFTSIVKGEQLQSEYIYFLQNLFEGCLWLANRDDPAVIIEEPEVQMRAMIPISRKEMIEESRMEFGDGPLISLETSLRNRYPHASDEWIEEEMIRIEESQAADDSSSLAAGRASMERFMDYPNDAGTGNAGNSGSDE